MTGVDEPSCSGEGLIFLGLVGLREEWSGVSGTSLCSADILPRLKPWGSPTGG